MTFKQLIFWTTTLLLMTACHKEPQISSEMSETFYLQNNNADMPVFVRGNGESKVFVLLLHGGPGDGGLKYRGHTYSDLLEKEYAMVYWDQRHQGNAHGHLPKENMTIDMMVEDTYALIQTLKVRYGNDISIFLMGHSWGGTLGTAFMLKDDYQHEVKGWIEVDGAHDFPLMNLEIIHLINEIGPSEIAAGNSTELWNDALDFANALDTTNINFNQTVELNGFAGKLERALTFLNPKSESNLGALELNFTGPNNPVAVNVNALNLPEEFYTELALFSATHKLNKITIPTLMQWGKYDFKVPLSFGQLSFDEIGSADKFLKIYNHSGHSPMRYEAELFVQDVVNFIEAFKE